MVTVLYSHPGWNGSGYGADAEADFRGATVPHRPYAKPVRGCLTFAKVGGNVQVVHRRSGAVRLSIPYQPTTRLAARKSMLLVLNGPEAASVDVDTLA